MRHNDRRTQVLSQWGDVVAAFLGLYLGHILGDFAFQPGRLVVAKRRSVGAVVLHTVIVTACTALVSAGALGKLWPTVLAAGVAHFGVEHLTIRARHGATNSGLTLFVLDQALHVVSLTTIATVAGLGAPPVLGMWQLPLATLAGVCAVATVALGGSILVFEVQLAKRPLDDGPDPILAFDAGRFYGIVERGGALTAALLLAVPALGALVFVPRLAYAFGGPADDRRDNLIAALTGLAICGLAWALVAWLATVD